MIDLQFSSSFACNLLNSSMRRFFAVRSSKWNENGPWRIPSVSYTLEHKLAFLEREHYLTGHYSVRGIVHDWEKPFLYLCPWIDSEKKIQEMHRRFSPHHVGCPKTSKVEHLIEMYIDWDCAAITKPDKPLNAFETLVHFYPEYINVMLPVCLVFDIEAVKPRIYLHPWHKLVKEPEYNREIFARVCQTLNYIIETLPQTRNDFRKITGKYQKLRNITLCSPAEIFILTLKKQQESLGIDIDMEKLRQLLKEVRNGFFIRKIFTHCPHDEIAHNCKKVKKYPFAV